MKADSLSAYEFALALAEGQAASEVAQAREQRPAVDPALSHRARMACRTADERRLVNLICERGEFVTVRAAKCASAWAIGLENRLIVMREVYEWVHPGAVGFRLNPAFQSWLGPVGDVGEPMSFRQWLKLQGERDEPTGDIARDILADRACLPGACVVVGDAASSLQRRGVTESYERSFVQAWREYRQTPGGRAAYVSARPGVFRRRRRPVGGIGARSISPSLRSRILERDAFRCRRCGAGPQDDRLVIDHILAVALGGGSEPGNLQTLCSTCNAGKSDHPPHLHDLCGPS